MVVEYFRRAAQAKYISFVEAGMQVFEDFDM